jgi:hypothetical protein
MPVDAQPFLVTRGEVGRLPDQVDIEVIPAPDQRCGQLTVRDDDLVPVVTPAKALGLALRRRQTRSW